MSGHIAADASLSLVGLHLDLPHMHGFHRFIAIERPNAKTCRLLHTVHLTVITMPKITLERVARGPIEPRTLRAVLRRRRQDLVHHKRRHAGGLVEDVISRLDSQISQPTQLDLEDLIDQAPATRRTAA